MYGVVTGSENSSKKEGGPSLQINLGSVVWKPTNMV